MKKILFLLLALTSIALGANVPLYTVPQTNVAWMLVGVSLDGSNIVKIDINLFAPSNSLWSATNGMQAQINIHTTAITNLSTNLQAQIDIIKITNSANTQAAVALTNLISTLQARADAAAATNYASVLAARFMTNALPPIGSIVAWAPSLTNALGVLDTNIWQQCDGQTITDPASILFGYHVPNLNGASAGVQMFLRGAVASGNTGGAETHTHDIDLPGGGNSQSYTELAIVSPGTYTTAAADSKPPYYEVVWLIRVK